MSTTIIQSLTYNILIVSEKIAMLKFLPQTDSRPDTDHYVDSQFVFMSVNKWYIRDLLDILDNHAKFQFNQLKTSNKKSIETV